MPSGERDEEDGHDADRDANRQDDKGFLGQRPGELKTAVELGYFQGTVFTAEKSKTSPISAKRNGRKTKSHRILNPRSCGRV